MLKNSLLKLDENAIPELPDEIRAFACIRDEWLRLPFVLDYHRRLGVGRFFFIDNGSTDGTIDFLRGEVDCHVFAWGGNFFAENVDPPVWTNALRNAFGAGHWCLSLDADEMFVYPDCETVPLPVLCDYLDRMGSDAVEALVIDMYGRDAIVDANYRRHDSFLSACPHFDPELGWTVAADGQFPPELMFSRFRERAFWHGSHRKKRPPCITQVPLVKWRKGTGYLVAQHSLNTAVLSELRAAVLHFKFLQGFYEATVQSLEQNAQVAEKGLEERRSYVDALSRDPRMTLYHPGSATYRNSAQLVQLGWMRRPDSYARYMDGLRLRAAV